MNAKEVRKLNISIVVLCLIAFFPALRADFVYYDDPEYILNNRFIQSVSFQNIVDIFLGKPTILYVPLTHLTYMMEYGLFGNKPFSYHAINLVFHILNALLLFRILLKLGLKNTLLIQFLLLFFAINPMVCESVCWVTERKDVLYCFFYFLSALAFLNHLSKPSGKQYIYSILFFVLSCLSKPMAVTLPFLMLIYVVYIFGKKHLPYTLKLVPFFLLSLVFALLTFYMVNVGKQNKTLDIEYGFLERAVLGISTLGFYFFRPFFPLSQQVIYPFPLPESLLGDVNVRAYALAFFAFLLIFLVRIFKKKYKTDPFLFAGWMVLILPLLQLDTNNHSYVNERYLYISLIFPAALVFNGLQDFRFKTSYFGYAIVALALVFTMLSLRRTMAWKNTETLFTSELKADPFDAYALNNLGYFYNSSGNFLEGAGLLQEALRIQPKETVFLNNYGWALSELSAPDSAMAYFKKAVFYDERYIPALNNLGIMYAKKQQRDSAGVVFEWAYQLDPGNRETNYYMGVYCNFIGKPELAKSYFEKAKSLENKAP